SICQGDDLCGEGEPKGHHHWSEWTNAQEDWDDGSDGN
ncbi:MAG: hypothetical protein DFNUSKGM_003361, partial [Candidatus Fervidibacter sacchari]